MSARLITLLLAFCLLLPATTASAHGMYYRVDEQGVSARFFYTQTDPASYSAYEIFAPGESIPHKTGRTDKNGFVSFLPDRAGTWTVSVAGESDHGLHPKSITIEIGEGLFVASYQKPLVAEYLTVFMGLTMILFLYSLWVQFSSLRKPSRHPARLSVR
ncbi:hypothetical protein [Desulfonatronum parangueonense]